jgi:hypothetical protein
MAIGVRRHLDGGMAEPGLHHLERQFEPAATRRIWRAWKIEAALAAAPAWLLVPIFRVGGYQI